MTRDARGKALVAILRRRSGDLETIFHLHGLTQGEALTVLDEAVLEVQLRCARIEDMEARLLRAIHRGCDGALEDRRRAAEAGERADCDEPVSVDAD